VAESPLNELPVQDVRHASAPPSTFIGEIRRHWRRCGEATQRRSEAKSTVHPPSRRQHPSADGLGMRVGLAQDERDARSAERPMGPPRPTARGKFRTFRLVWRCP
jgi:hypothetical protein